MHAREMHARKLSSPAADEIEEAAISAIRRQSDIRALKLEPSPAGEVSAVPSQLINALLEKRAPEAPESVIQEAHHVALILVRGNARIHLGGDPISLNPGDVALLPPGVAATTRTEGQRPSDRIFLVFDSPELELPAPSVIRDAAGRLRELGNWLVSERRAAFAGAAGYRERVLTLFVSELVRLKDDSCSALERQTRAYVLEHISEPISLHDLASNVGMSRHYFCRLYHKVSGESPMTTVRNLRLQRARELALTTKLPLRVIAERVGLNSQYHLSRMLRSHFGVGVKELRTGVPAEEEHAPESAVHA